MNLQDLPQDLPYLVGVSGGQDSVALLEHLLREGFSSLIVCHLNHQLRGLESEGDEAFVRSLTQRLDLPCEVERVNVSSLARRDRLSLEAAARQARHRFFLACAAKRKAAALFLAHHADDQSETILLHLLRGTGITGLCGMAKISSLHTLTVYRPFLSLRKSDLPPASAYRVDSSNASPLFLRNRLRHQAIPALESALGHDPIPALLRLADIASQDNLLLEDLTGEALHQAQDGAHLKTPELLALHPALQRRVILRWLSLQGIPDCGFQEVESVRSLFLNPSPHAPAQINLPGDHHVRRRERRLWIPSQAEPANPKQPSPPA